MLEGVETSILYGGCDRVFIRVLCDGSTGHDLESGVLDSGKRLLQSMFLYVACP